MVYGYGFLYPAQPMKAKDLEFNLVKCLVLFFFFLINPNKTNACDHQIKQTKLQPVTTGLNQSQMGFVLLKSVS